MCEFNTKVQSSNSMRLTIVSAKSKIHFPRGGYLSPGYSIVLEKKKHRMLYYSYASHLLADFGDNLSKFKQSSNSPVYFRACLLNDMMI